MPKISLNASKKTKHTPAGEIPVDWGCVKFGEAISSTQLGGNYAGELTNSGTPLMKMGNMLRGKFDVSRFERIPDSQVNECDILNNQDLLLNTRNSLDLVGKVSMWRNELDRAVFNSNMMRLSPNQQIIHSNAFLNYVLNSEHCLKEIAQRATGTTSVAAIYWRDLATMRIPIPSSYEQRKIADILSTWDEALETLDALIAAKDRQKQALMQQLLTGKTRVKGAKGKWKKVRFSEWLTESRIPGTDGSSAKKITVKLYGRGVYPKQDRLIGSENTKYYVRRAGQFIYSKLDFLNGAFGIVPEILDGYESTLDLPSFDVSPNADAKWLLYYVTRPEFYSQQLGAAAGGRKARRVNPSEFLAMKILAPEFSEQQQIAAILNTADQELTLLRSQRQTLDQQKRGLMQRLLTGKTRVKP